MHDHVQLLAGDRDWEIKLTGDDQCRTRLLGNVPATADKRSRLVATISGKESRQGDEAAETERLFCTSS